MHLIVLACVALVLFLLLWVFFREDDYWSSRKVPQERPLPLVGNFLNLFLGRENIIQLTERFCRTIGGPYYGLSLLNVRILVVKDPDLIKAVLVQDFHKFENRKIATYEKADPIICNTLFLAKSQQWKVLRPKLSPAFSSGKIKMMFPLMVSCAEDMMDHVRRGCPNTLDFKEICSKFSTNVIASCAFGVDAKCFENPNAGFLIACKRMFEPTLSRSFSQFCYYFMPSLIPIFRLKFVEGRAAEFLKKAFLNVVRERKGEKTRRNDLVDLFFKLKEDGELNRTFPFSDDLMVAQAIIFIIAGHESTSTLISCALYEMAVNQDIQERLRKEIASVEKEHSGITHEAIAEMKYLDMVLQETLRKYPFVPLISREATEDYTFEKTGLKIEKGTSIAISLHGIHCDPKFHPSPTEFNPERFSKENRADIKPYTFIPFSEGPRNCIGIRFGTLSSKIGLAYMIKNFTIELSPETNVPLRFSKKSNILVSENGIPLIVKAIQ